MRGRRPKYPTPKTSRPVFRRYRNRRYYSIDERRYVDSTVLLNARRPIVIDAQTGVDITVWAIAAARLEAMRRKLETEARRLGIIQ